jgi:hypothetical protein
MSDNPTPNDEVNPDLEASNVFNGVDGGTDYSSYVAPPGYVLVEKNQYNIMLKAMNAQLEGRLTEAPKNTRIDEYGQTIHQDDYTGVFKLTMLRQYWIGDININLLPGTEVVFCPGQWVKIDGERHKKLKSFLAIFKSQFGPKPDAGVLAKPIFELRNEDDCPDLSQLFGRELGKPTFPSDEARIAHEVKHGDAAKQKISVPGDVKDQLQMRTTPQPRAVPPGKPDHMTDRAWMIANMQADQIERPQGSNMGSQHDQTVEPQTVNDFQTIQRMAGGGTPVAMIPGKPADEAKAAKNNRR